MAIEIERRFLLKQIPAELLDTATAQIIRQGYIAVEGHPDLRVRHKVDSYYVSRKCGDGLLREEYEAQISGDAFEVLWPLTIGRRIEKTRYCVPAGILTLEIDIFEGALAPLKILEVEFDSEAAAHTYQPPDWAGRELTGDGRYSNAQLTRTGLPNDWSGD